MSWTTAPAAPFRTTSASVTSSKAPPPARRGQRSPRKVLPRLRGAHERGRRRRRHARLGRLIPIRFESTLEPLLRESITLLVAQDEQSSYEWRAHERLAKEAGASDDDIEALRRGEVPESHDPQRDQALRFAGAVLTDDLDHSAFSPFQNHLEDALMVEIVILVGYYRALALLLRVFTINWLPSVRGRRKN